MRFVEGGRGSDAGSPIIGQIRSQLQGESLHGPVTVGAHPNAFRKVQLLDFDPIIVGQIRRQPIWEPSNIHAL